MMTVWQQWSLKFVKSFFSCHIVYSSVCFRSPWKNIFVFSGLVGALTWVHCCLLGSELLYSHFTHFRSNIRFETFGTLDIFSLLFDKSKYLPAPLLSFNIEGIEIRFSQHVTSADGFQNWQIFLFISLNSACFVLMFCSYFSTHPLHWLFLTHTWSLSMHLSYGFHCGGQEWTNNLLLILSLSLTYTHTQTTT